MSSSEALLAAKTAALESLSILSTPSEAPKRRGRRKRQRASATPTPAAENGRVANDETATAQRTEYIPESIVDIAHVSPAVPVDIAEIKDIVHRFQTRGLPDDAEQDVAPERDEAEAPQEKPSEPRGDHPSGDKASGEKGGDDTTTVISRKQRKEATRNMISRLKSLSDSPSVVEPWDITAADALLLVHLKSWPNSVPVPANWRQKRKYLQNKRGLEKRAFQLPAYIVDTGVGEIRDAQLSADEKKTLKQRQREKMRAKTGRGVEIDHTRLHDAFFKFQTKPRLTSHGDLYYELRELEVDYSKFRPGNLSEELCAALGIGPREPAPWLVQMQRYGPPPGYPGMKIPGLNCPIPVYGRFGLGKGEWGKPPVDEMGRPIYGDVFGEGIAYGGRDERFDVSEEQKQYVWGESVREVGFGDGGGDEEDGGREEVAVEEEKEGDGRKDGDGVGESVEVDGGREAPQGIELRKGIASGKLYAVLEEEKRSVGGALMGSSHGYKMSGGGGEETNVGAGEKGREDGEERRAVKRRKEFKF